jgi:hypothetical protein
MTVESFVAAVDEEQASTKRNAEARKRWTEVMVLSDGNSNY